MHHQISERAKIAGAIAKLGRVSHIVFRAVAGISNTSAVRQRLRNSIEGRHTDTGREVYPRLIADVHIERDLITYRRHCFGDIGIGVSDTQKFDQLLTIVQIRLFSIRHHNTHYTLFAQCLYAKSGDNAGIFTTRNTDHRITARAVTFKVGTNPLDNLILSTLWVS